MAALVLLVEFTTLLSINRDGTGVVIKGGTGNKEMGNGKPLANLLLGLKVYLKSHR